MKEKSNILLATFCTPAQVMRFCRKLWLTFPHDENLDKIFLLKVDGEDKKILTYNLGAESSKINYKTILPSTVQIHRKKDTNTLYTINAINAIQLKINGKIDPGYQIDWNEYKECILIERQGEVVILKTELERIFWRDKKDNNGHDYDSMWDDIDSIDR